MKYLAFILLLLLSTSSCNRDDRTRYEQRINAELILPTGLNQIETHAFIIRDVNSFFNANATLNGYSPAEVDEVLAGRGNMNLLFSNNGLGFIERVSIRVFNTPTPLSWKEMYYFDFIPINEGAQVNLFNSISNLESIVTNETFDLEVRLKFRSFIPANTRLEFDLGYLVYIK